MERLIKRLNSDTFVPLIRFVNERNILAVSEFQKILKKDNSNFLPTKDPIFEKGEEFLVCDVDRYGLKLEYVLNDLSGVVRAKEYYAPDVLDVFYKNYYREIYTLGDWSFSKLFSNQILLGERILSLLREKNIAVKSVLDVGTGVGGALLPFKEQGMVVEGIDLNTNSVEWGERNVAANVSSKSLQILKNESKKFDLIILNHVIEHVIEINDFLNDVKQLLSINGVIYISVPSLEVVTKWYKSDFGTYFQNAHVWNFSMRSFHLLLEKNDLVPLFANENIDSLVTRGAYRVPEEIRNDIHYEKRILKKTEDVYLLKDIKPGFLLRAARFSQRVLNDLIPVASKDLALEVEKEIQQMKENLLGCHK